MTVYKRVSEDCHHHPKLIREHNRSKGLFSFELSQKCQLGVVTLHRFSQKVVGVVSPPDDSSGSQHGFGVLFSHVINSVGLLWKN